MKRIVKFAAAASMTGALALAAATPSQAASGRNIAVAANVASNSGYHNVGYFGPDYPNDPGYAYAPAPGYQAYDYAPGPGPAYGGRCWISTDNSRNLGYYGSCASDNQDMDAETLGQARPNKSFVRP